MHFAQLGKAESVDAVAEVELGLRPSCIGTCGKGIYDSNKHSREGANF